MSDSPELQKAVENLTAAIGDFRSVADLVRKDVYAADKLAADKLAAADKLMFANQVAAVDRDVRDLERQLREAEQERKAEKTRAEERRRVEHQAAEERRRADRRLVFTALLAPVLLIILQLYIQAQTGG